MKKATGGAGTATRAGVRGQRGQGQQGGGRRSERVTAAGAGRGGGAGDEEHGDTEEAKAKRSDVSHHSINIAAVHHEDDRLGVLVVEAPEVARIGCAAKVPEGEDHLAVLDALDVKADRRCAVVRSGSERRRQTGRHKPPEGSLCSGPTHG